MQQVQNQAGNAAAIRLAQAGPAPRGGQAPKRAEQREFVEGAIRFLHSGAEFFRDGATINEDSIERQLQGWFDTVQNALGIIQNDLGGDAQLTTQVRDAYQDAVTSFIRVASQTQNRTTQELFQQHRERIHDFALPQASTDPQGSDLSNALPAATRRRIQVITTNVAIQNLHDLFSTEGGRTIIALPDGAAVHFAGAIPESLRHGLRNVAGQLIPGTLRPNSTITLALDLERHGGDYSAYRFTFTEGRRRRGRQPTRQILIEHLGAVGVEGLAPADIQAQHRRFDAHNFSRSGWSNDDEFERLLQAIALVPDATLTQVDGLSFERDSAGQNQGEGGHYDPDRHTVVMYDRTFDQSSTRFGVPGQSLIDDATRSILHEIGHAVDIQPLNQAWARANQAGTQRRLPRARSASGYRWQLNRRTRQWNMVQGGRGVAGNAFRRAAIRDGGVRITEYAETDWMEYYAEAFALFMNNPEGLHRLRPNVHDHFAARHLR